MHRNAHGNAQCPVASRNKIQHSGYTCARACVRWAYTKEDYDKKPSENEPRVVSPLVRAFHYLESTCNVHGPCFHQLIHTAARVMTPCSISRSVEKKGSSNLFFSRSRLASRHLLVSVASVAEVAAVVAAAVSMAARQWATAPVPAPAPAPVPALAPARDYRISSCWRLSVVRKICSTRLKICSSGRGTTSRT